jgi:WD40 repeat protein/serine/threonine protein kinase
MTDETRQDAERILNANADSPQAGPPDDHAAHDRERDQKTDPDTCAYDYQPAPSTETVAYTDPGKKVIAGHSTSKRYTVLGRVAHGGMGVIFKVWDGNLNRPLAMKVIRGQDQLDAANVTPVGSELLARFLREAEITGQLDHPGIVPVHEIGTDERGRVYFTMRLVEGESLGAVLDKMWKGDATWTQTRIVDVLVKICETLAFAHSRGVVHRDLKPANVMVGRFGETYVMDWGLAKVLPGRNHPCPGAPALDGASAVPQISEGDECELPAGGVDSADLTMAGTVLGTPAYMPLEQAEGRQDELDERSDVYSVGAMLYQALTGQIPYYPSGSARSFEDVLLAVKAGPPMPVAQLAPRAPAELVAICNKAMARDRSARYADMREMAEDLRAYLENRVVKAYQRGAVAELKKWVMRNRLAAVAGLAAIVIFIGGLLTTLGVQSAANQKLRDANVAIKKESEEKETALANERVAHQQAVAQQKRAEGLYLAQQSAAQIEANPGLALLLALESSKRHPSLLANNALLAALDACREERTLLGHADPVTAASFSRDGTRILTASQDNTACIWDAATGRPTALLIGHTDWVPQAVFHPDGKRAATASYDGTAAIWDTASGACVRQFKGHKWRVGAVAFSPDGKRLATGSWDMTARIWNAETGQLLQILSGHKAYIRLVAFSPDGTKLLTASADATARLWDAVHGKLLAVLEGHQGGISSASFSPDGKSVLTAAGMDAADGTAELQRAQEFNSSTDTTARLWNATSGTLLRRFEGHRAPVHVAVFSPDGSRIATGGADRVVRVWHTAGTGEPLVLTGHDGGIRALAFSPDGSALAAATAGRVARLWDTNSGKLLAQFGGHEDGVECCAFSPDGARVLTASRDHSARVWRAHGPVPAVKVPAGPVSEVGISPDGKRAVIRSVNVKSVAVCTLPDGRLIASLEHDQPVKFANFSPDGSQVCTVSTTGVIRLWRAAMGTPSMTLPPAAGPADNAVFSSDGKELVILGPTSATRWNVKSGAMIRCRVFTAHDRRLGPDGKWLLTWSKSSSEIELWDTGTGRMTQLREVGHKLRAAFSPDGTRIVTWPNEARSASLWDAGSGIRVGVLEGHTARIHRVFFSADSRWIVTASQDGSARVWDTTGKLRTYLVGDDGELLLAEPGPDGTRLVTQTSSGVARLWDVESGRCLTVLHRGNPPVYAAHFGLQGKRLLLQYRGHRELTLWDAEQGVPLAVLEDRRGFTGSAMTPDERWIITVVAGQARIWPTDPAGLAERARPRSLTPAERERYPFGTAGERAAHRRKQDVANGCHTLKLLARTLAFRPDNANAVRDSFRSTLRGMLESLDIAPADQSIASLLQDIEQTLRECGETGAASLTLLAARYRNIGDNASAQRVRRIAPESQERSP